MAHPKQYFRAGVGALITEGKGHVLALERADISGAWQLPQGGLEAGEDPLQAIIREIQEETGVSSSQLELIGQCPYPLAYELPPDAQSQKTGRGQVQYWFLFKLEESGNVINLQGVSEFRAWKWMSLEHLVDKTVAFRVPLYRQLETYFSPNLKPAAK